jgi:predicted ATP-grasp superfamily ATP-dependent carboligase
MSVLVTEANLGSSVNVIRSLGRRGIKVVAGDVSRVAAGYWSKYCNSRILYPDPYHKEEFVRAIIKAKRETGFDIIFGLSDSTLKPLAMEKERLEREGIVLPIPRKENFFKMCDKFETYKLAEETGVECPITFLPESKDELSGIAREIGFPIVVKPRGLSGGRGIVYAKSSAELVMAFEKIHRLLGQPPMVQEYIPGRGNVFTVAMIFDKKSRLVTSIVMRKIRESPLTGGAATFAETVYSPKIEELAVKLLTRAKWIGVVAPEFKWDPRDGKPKLMEVNPRFFGYLKLAMSAGVDLPYILYQVISEEERYFNRRYIGGLRFSRIVHDLFVLYRGLFELGVGEKFSFLKDFVQSYARMDKVAFDYLSIEDPLPFFFSIICMVGREIGLVRKPFEVIKKKW